MAENPAGDTPAPKGSQTRTEQPAAPGIEKDPGADVCGSVEVIKATTQSESLELEEHAGHTDFSVITQIDSTDQRLVTVAASYEGPLPPPSYLKGYEETVPGSGKEIISWVKEESEHRRQMELAELGHRQQTEIAESQHRRGLETRAMDLGEKALSSGIFRANFGMFLSWPLMLLVVVAGSVLVYMGHDTSGTTIVISGLTVIGSTYVVDRIAKARMESGKSKSKDETKDEDGAD